MHRFRGRALQAPFNRRENAQGTTHSFQQNFTGLFHPDLAKLQSIRTGRPCRCCRQLQAGIRLRLKPEAQLPKLLSLRWGIEGQAGAGRSEVAGDSLTPVVAGGGEALGVFVTDFDHAGLRSQCVLPER